MSHRRIFNPSRMTTPRDSESEAKRLLERIPLPNLTGKITHRDDTPFDLGATSEVYRGYIKLNGNNVHVAIKVFTFYPRNVDHWAVSPSLCSLFTSSLIIPRPSRRKFSCGTGSSMEACFLFWVTATTRMAIRCSSLSTWKMEMQPRTSRKIQP